MYLNSLGNKFFGCVGRDDQVVRLDSLNIAGADKQQVEREGVDEELGIEPTQSDVTVATASHTGCLQSVCDKLKGVAAFFQARTPEQRAVLGSIVGGGVVATVTGVALACSAASADAGPMAAMAGPFGGVAGALAGYATSYVSCSGADPAQHG